MTLDVVDAVKPPAGPALRRAVLHRTVTAGHVCPHGLKALHLLRRKGFMVEDRHLTSRAEADAFKAEHGVRTTPQIFIEGRRIGGHDDLRRHFGLAVRDRDAVSYAPVLAVFAVSPLMALAIAVAAGDPPASVLTVERFIAVAMCLLAMLKLQDLESFATMFLNYDLLARRYVPYAYVYPFAELGAGVLMLAGVLAWLSIPIALVIGTIGAVSVFKAVFMERREIRCACVGGSSRVPLGFVSLTENLAMAGMALWMLFAHPLM
jgi:glutaredoxin